MCVNVCACACVRRLRVYVYKQHRARAFVHAHALTHKRTRIFNNTFPLTSAKGTICRLCASPSKRFGRLSQASSHRQTQHTLPPPPLLITCNMFPHTRGMSLRPLPPPPPPLTPFFSCSCAPSQAAFSSSQVNWKCKAPTLPHSHSFFKVILGCNFGGRYGGLLFAWVKRTLQPR